MASSRSSSGLRATSLLYLASIASALPALGDFKFHGCYTDHGDHRSLTGKKSYDPKMTLQMCAATCHNYQWFGVEYGSQCFCGTGLASTAEKRPDTECTMKCAGSHCQSCGDADRLGVFWTGRDTTASNLGEVDGFRYQSCWTDNSRARSLTGSENPREDMTVEMCAGFCKGFKYFGVESTSECFCGNELGGEAAPEEECSELCGGNAAEWCGGPDRLNIYAVEPSAPESTSTPAEESTTVTEPATAAPEESTTITEPATTATEASTTPELTPTPEPTPTLTPTPTTACDLTTLYLPTPSLCWASIPSACSYLARTPAIPWPAITPQAQQCTRAFLGQGYSLAPAVVPCFTDIANPNFNANSAYNCLATADVYCQPTAVCKAAPRPTPTNVLGEGGFEDGALWPNMNAGGLGGADVITVGVSSERAHTGNFALKMVYTNANGGSRSWTKEVSLEAGGLYEISWWFWSQNDRSATIMRIYFNGGGQTILYDVGTKGVPTGQWVRTSRTFVAGSTYGTAQLLVGGNRETDGNVVYVDDVSIVRID